MGIVTADMIRMTPDTSKVHAIWLSAALNHDRSKRQVAAITAGVTRAKVTLADFRSLRISVPELSEQKRMIKVINRQQELIDVEEKKSVKLQKEKLGLMHDLLTGKVHVTINEGDTDD